MKRPLFENLLEDLRFFPADLDKIEQEALEYINRDTKFELPQLDVHSPEALVPFIDTFDEFRDLFLTFFGEKTSTWGEHDRHRATLFIFYLNTVEYVMLTRWAIQMGDAERATKFALAVAHFWAVCLVTNISLDLLTGERVEMRSLRSRRMDTGSDVEIYDLVTKCAADASFDPQFRFQTGKKAGQPKLERAYERVAQQTGKSVAAVKRAYYRVRSREST